MKVVLTATARKQLEAIGDYIALDNPRRARSFVQELRTCAKEIGAAPELFPLVPRYERFGIRRRTFGRYLIFYRIDGGEIAILHILHGARDIEQILSGDD